MEYEKIINLLDYTPNQPSKFKTKKTVQITDESRRRYNEDKQIRFKTSMLRSSLCDYSDAYILVKKTITAISTAAQGQPNTVQLLILLQIMLLIRLKSNKKNNR